MLATAMLCLAAAPIVFLGDGFVKGWDDSGKSVWEAEFARNSAYGAENGGVDGETAASLAKRLTDGAVDLAGAKAVVIAVGGEDLKEPSLAVRSPLDVILDIQAIIGEIRKRNPEAKIVLNPVFPRGARLDDPERRRGNATRVAIRDFQNAKDILWCDVSIKLVDDAGALKPEMFAGVDRFTAAGYAVWAKELKRFLGFALGRVPHHPYPQLGTGPMFPENAGLPAAAKPRFKRYFLTAKERRYAVKRAEQRRRARTEYDAVWVGDSCTHFWELWNGTPTFDRLFKGKYEILNLGFGGDDTADCLWTCKWSGLQDGYRAKVICLLIGSNNLPPSASDELIAETAQGTKRIIAELRAKHPESTILLQPALPRGFEPTSPYRRILAQYNDIIKTYADGEKVVWVGELYGRILPADGTITKDILCDGVHPNKKGYRIWGETLLPYIEKYCGRR